MFTSRARRCPWPRWRRDPGLHQLCETTHPGMLVVSQGWRYEASIAKRHVWTRTRHSSPSHFLRAAPTRTCAHPRERPPECPLRRYTLIARPPLRTGSLASTRDCTPGFQRGQRHPALSLQTTSTSLAARITPRRPAIRPPPFTHLSQRTRRIHPTTLLSVPPARTHYPPVRLPPTHSPYTPSRSFNLPFTRSQAAQHRRMPSPPSHSARESISPHPGRALPHDHDFQFDTRTPARTVSTARAADPMADAHAARTTRSRRCRCRCPRPSPTSARAPTLPSPPCQTWLAPVVLVHRHSSQPRKDMSSRRHEGLRPDSRPDPGRGAVDETASPARRGAARLYVPAVDPGFADKDVLDAVLTRAMDGWRHSIPAARDRDGEPGWFPEARSGRKIHRIRAPATRGGAQFASPRPLARARAAGVLYTGHTPVSRSAAACIPSAALPVRLVTGAQLLTH